MATPGPSGMTRKTARYGWTPDLPDARDHLFAAPQIALAALPPSADLRSACPPVYDQGKLHDTVDVLVSVGEEHEVSAARVALAYLLAKPAVTSLVVGARTSEQLADNLAAADLELSPADIERLDKVSAPVLLYPYWHQAKTARDRLSPADLTLLGPHL